MLAQGQDEKWAQKWAELILQSGNLTAATQAIRESCGVQTRAVVVSSPTRTQPVEPGHEIAIDPTTKQVGSWLATVPGAVTANSEHTQVDADMDSEDRSAVSSG